MSDYGTVTLAETTHTSVKRISFTWLSEDGGAHGGEATKTTVNAYDGLLERVVFVPGTGGVLPDDAYDVTLLDADGADVLAGQGANLDHDNTVTKTHANGLAAVAGSTLTLSVSGAGNANGGTVIVYLR